MQHKVAVVVGLVLAAATTSVAGSYDLLNDVLGGLRIEQAIEIPEINHKLSPGVTARARIGKTVFCSGFGVDDVAITGKKQEETVEVDGEDFEAYLVRAQASGLRLRCSIGLCVRVKFLFSLGEDCGTLTVISNSASKTEATLSSLVLSSDFATQLPTRAIEPGMTCAEMVKMNGIRFEGRNLAKVIGIDVTRFVVDALNGDMKGDVIGQIRDPVCEMLGGLSDTINAFVVDNPLVALVNVSGVDVVDPVALERRVRANLPQGVDLVDLGDNMVTNMLLDVQQDGAFQVDSGLLLAQALPLVGDFDESEIDPEAPALLSLVDAMVGVDLSSTENLGVIGAASQALGLNRSEVQEALTFAFAGDAFGRVEVELQEIFLQRSGELGEMNQFAFLGKQTLGLPLIALGDLAVSAALRVKADIVTTALLDMPIAFSLEETGSVDVAWAGFAVQLAGLLAIDANAVSGLELGALLEAVLECVMSVFHETPRFASFHALADSLSLRVNGLEDGMSNIVGDLVNAVAPIYEGGLPAALEHFASELLVDRELMEGPMVCPRVVETSPGELHKFSQGVVRQVSDAVNADLGNDLLTSLLGTSGGDRTLELIKADDTMVMFRANLPSVGGDTPSGMELALGNATVVVPLLEEVALLKVPEGAVPQLLHNALQTGSPLQVSLSLHLDLLGSATEFNELRLSFGMTQLDAVLDLLALVTEYDLESTPLGEVLNPSCWVGKLQTGSDLQELFVELDGLAFDIDCVNCESVVLRELAAEFQDPEARQDLIEVLIGLKDDVVSAVSEIFDEDSIARARIECEAGAATQAAVSFLPGVSQELVVAPDSATNATAFALGVAAVLLVAGIATCVAAARRKKVAVAVDVEAKALWQDEQVPRFVRLGMPVMLAVNVVLFVIGHIDVVIKIELVGELLRMPFALDNLAEFSIVSSTKELWDSGATVLAGFLAVFSIVWPYVKLLCMLLCWVLPPRWLSPGRRGTFLTVLDQLGKWSLLELYVLAFILVALTIQISAPDLVSFLPPRLYELSLNIVLQYNLYTFTLALLLSLALANVAVLYSDRHLASARAQGQPQLLPLPRMLVLGVLGVAIILLFVGATMPVLHLEIMGLIATVMQVSGDSPVNALSLFGFLGNLFSTSPVYGLVLMLSVFGIPLLQMAMLVALSVCRLDWNRAMRLHEVNKILCAWSALQVFVLAVCISVLELATVTSGLLSNQCDGIDPFLSTLSSVNLIQDKHANAGCFALDAQLRSGAFVFLAVMVLHNGAHIIVVDALERFLQDPESRRRQQRQHKVEMEFTKGPIDLA
ncbi:Uncharacterized protein (Fragment) [Durusdinium trenchii]|uniref:Uncharacterized protein n=1 Tax=Durusdinium trenchii TaxID=1381693 RepID=A0ABP0R921_9DINO